MNIEKKQINIIKKSEFELFLQNIEKTANFEGDWTLLLKDRLLNTEIKKQQLEKTSFWIGKSVEELCEEKSYSENEAEEFFKFQIKNLYINHYKQKSQIVKYELYDEFIEKVFKSTNYMTSLEYSENPEAENISKTIKAVSPAGMGTGGTLFKDRLFFNDGINYTNKQKNIIESHEKGHSVRTYTGKQKKEIEDVLEKRWLGNEEQKKYLGCAEEIIERMSQLKNYFGFSGSEEFTIEHLYYAREHYVEDVGLDLGMTLFMNAIIDEKKFLNIMNTYGV